MAKILANVAGFALIASSIGFNIWRYPVVWDMVGGSPCLSQANQSERSVAMTEPKKSAAPTVALQAAYPRWREEKQYQLAEDLAADETLAERIAGYRRQDGDVSGWSDHAVDPAAGPPPEPAAMMGVRPGSTAGKRCEPAGCAGSDAIMAYRSNTGQLIRVVRPMGSPNEACPPGSELQVIRLPSVDRIAPAPASRSLPSFAECPPLRYPATGIE